MNIEDYKRALQGVSGVHATAYDASGEIDAGLTGKVVGNIAKAGIQNIVTGGNTGEFYSLTFDEVVRLQAIAVEAAAGRSAVTAAAGRSIREAIETSRHAKRNGADGVMVHHPLDPFAAPHCQAEYFIAIADTIELPVVAYVRSDAIPLASIVRIAMHPNVAGVKFASTNTQLFAECVRATDGDGAGWICGLAEGYAAPFYALGGRGFTSGLVNVDPHRSLGIWNALEAGQYAEARALIAPIAEFEKLRTKYNNGANVTVVKEALQLQGYPVGKARLPNLPELDAADRVALTSIVKGLA